MKNTPSPGFTAVGGEERRSVLRAATDIIDGLRHWHLWTSLARFDLARNYRRSYIGPFWITINSAIFIAGIGLVFTFVFSTSANKYVPHLAGGFITWQLISSAIKGGTTVFAGAQNLLLQKNLPYSVHAFRFISNNFLTFAHNLVLIIPIWIIYDEFPGWICLLSLAGVAAVLFNSIWVVLLLGTVCLRYRDFGELIPGVLQLLFFLTPIMWHPARLGEYQIFLQFNPFYSFVEIIRAPLLGSPAPLSAWIAVLAITCLGWGVTLKVYGQYRKRIVFWL